jgi:hypothetical protein
LPWQRGLDRCSSSAPGADLQRRVHKDIGSAFQTEHKAGNGREDLLALRDSSDLGIMLPGRPLMTVEIEPVPGVTDDPVLQLILSGRAKSLDEAEELFLDESLPVILDLIASPLRNEELANHPLLALLRSRGMRGREDSLL